MNIDPFKLQENISLKDYHTFNIEVSTKYFIALNSVAQVEHFVDNIKDVPKPIYILGGGANSLFINDFRGTVVHIANKGIDLIQEDEDSVYIRVQAGEDWDDFVKFCVENEYYGVENLRAIPGQVGTAPVQNIGAYGAEAKDCIYEVFYIDIDDTETYVLNNEECEFDYRDSIFKNELKNQCIITEVVFRLLKNGKLNLEYGAIKEELRKQAIIQPTIAQLSDTIEKIRASKLPNPKEIGNGGSFFKNPVIEKSHFDELKKNYPDIVAYELSNGKMKIAAGWMIDYLGWKGKEHKGAAVHNQQALVLINKNNAQGEDIVELANMIQEDIIKHFQISLETEVLYI